ncbi:DUF2059 domain-containing protein [Ideonella alba]|uniref:DUF2059 domain-containing protein n=1 Tax=Ideonella alba TaxID=2824118 RepID=A0A941BHU7_9BURK|nr:DUF2059 domain-containing protein [Ideonella alba]MBQ0932013.1 DUF2059 domain-containing protein [Ideonella alba]
MTHFPMRCLCVALAALLWLPAQAQDSLADRQAAADRYLQVVPMSRMLDDAFAEIGKQVPATHRAQFLADMKAIVRVDALETLTREAMVRTFTADELNALADFYGSTHGASAMKKFGTYIAQVIPAVQAEVQRGLEQLQRQRSSATTSRSS